MTDAQVNQIYPKPQSAILFDDKTLGLITYSGADHARELMDNVRDLGYPCTSPIAQEAAYLSDVMTGASQPADIAVAILSRMLAEGNWDIEFSALRDDGDIPCIYEEILILGYSYLPLDTVKQVSLGEDEGGVPTIDVKLSDSPEIFIPFPACLSNPRSILSLEYRCPGIVKAALVAMMPEAKGAS